MFRTSNINTTIARVVMVLTFIAALVLPLAAGVVAFAETMLRLAGAPYEADYAPFFIGAALFLLISVTARAVQWATEQDWGIDFSEVEVPEVRFARVEAVTA